MYDYSKEIQPKDILSVSKLNAKICELIEVGIGYIEVEGEVSNFTSPRSGHWYFSLKDEKAQVRCAMFLFQNRSSKLKPKDGMKIRVKAKPTLYTARGDFQLIVDKMQESGVGDLQLAYQLLVKKLTSEGLFAPERKKPIPKIAANIAIITSATGAALQDILKVITRRNPLVDIKLYPAFVQGEQAPESLITAINQVHSDAICDLILLARGGGSIEDLWCFNNENLARVIFDSEIPIITGVGHESDFTIADLVADLRAPTPSAAAELAVIDIESLLLRLNNAKQALMKTIKQILTSAGVKLNNSKSRLKDPRRSLQRLNEKLEQQKELLIKQLSLVINGKYDKVANLAKQLHAVSPLATLSRGYSITQLADTKKVVTDISQVKEHDTIKVTLSEGSLIACVKSKSKQS